MEEVAYLHAAGGQYAGFAENYGDMTVHEVAVGPGQEPRLRFALRARHAGALLHYTGLKEVGASSEAAAPTTGASRSTRWTGRRNPGSDRDRGLRIFEYVKGYVGDGQ